MTDTPAALDAWLRQAKQRVKAAPLAPATEDAGRVESIADGIALVSGLPNVRLDELVRFERGQAGFALTLDRDVFGCVLLDDAAGVEAGDRVSCTGEVMRAPVGPELLGRIVDPLGRPLDGGGSIQAESYEPVERPAPAIIERDFVSEPVQTGLLVVDSMFALGRGQRELIIGDRAIGKTALAVDCIINQKNSGIVCVYVAIGQKSSTVARVISAIREHGAPERCIFVIAGASAAPGLQWIAPFAGFTMAEYYRDRGQHALIVIDDLTKHAATHREIALLTRQPPGREAYPGDVFYVHARLLERAAKLSAAKGGGSLTALPIAEIDAGNLSAYIPTNLISITDGQIVLELAPVPRRAQAGRRRRHQRQPRRAARRRRRRAAPSETLRLDYAQFLELEMFTRFGGVTDVQVKGKIARGRRIRAILSQPQYASPRLVDEVALLLALQGGLLDALPLEVVGKFRAEVPGWLDLDVAAIASEIERTGCLGDAARSRLMASLAALAGQLAAPSPGG